MRKWICLLLAACMLFSLAACGAKLSAPVSPAETEETAPVAEAEVPAEAEAVEEATIPDAPAAAEDAAVPEESAEPDESVSAENGTFTYVHDPRENPAAMADIVENPDAVYGFSPNPDSKRLGPYAKYDWTDPAVVAVATENRRAYHESMDSMTDILYRMRDEGASIEEMARAVSAERNRLRLEVYKDDPETLASVKESNLKTYGHEDGPTADELFEKYGSWILVLQGAFSSNMGMDACCGLYDECYPLYIELGYVE